MNKLFTQLLENRRISDDYLYPKYENLIDPFVLPDMTSAIFRIERVIQNREKVLIYGDYDVDGVTAATLMEKALNLAGVSGIEIMLPDRFIDGYGMSPRLIEKAQDIGANLVITVDCGSRNHDIVNELNTLGIDTIITDHHECADTLPEAIAVINPKRHDFEDSSAELKNLAGVGVAFKFAQALAKKGMFPEGQEKWLLDLVLLGTICDQMLLTGENRILSFYGLKVLQKTRRKGLLELMRSAKVASSITSEDIGFRVGPRLNAAGRLETAEIALNLLRTNSATRAASLTAKVEQLNSSRRQEQRAAIDEIIARHQDAPIEDPVIIETGKWHEGIIGIVAGRLVEQYQRPAFVLAEVENGIYKGSGRSFGDFSLAEALNYAKDAIISGGGHAAAAGVRVDSKNLYAFREKINEYYRSLNLKDQKRFFLTKPDLFASDIGDISLDLIDSFKLLEPFGAGNEEPVLSVTATLKEIKRMGDTGQHLCLIIADEKGHTLKCVAFFAPKDWFSLYPDETYAFLIKPIEDNFRNIRSAEARLIDVISN